MHDPSISSTFEQRPAQRPAGSLSFGQCTHPGRVRDDNEDHLGAAPDIGFFMVADGVGGSPGGSVASRIATAAMLQSLRAGSSEPELPDGPAQTEMHGPRLVAATLIAHNMIRDLAARSGAPGAATTMAALWVARDHVHVANTGDSRVYRLDGAGLEQLSKDHTAIQEAIDEHGSIEGRWRRILGNVVTQVLGGKSGRPPAVYLASRPLAAREVFLLCTDGLTNMVSEADIAFVLRSGLSPQHAAEVLVELANDEGGLDNVTCLVVEAEP